MTEVLLMWSLRMPSAARVDLNRRPVSATWRASTRQGG